MITEIEVRVSSGDDFEAHARSLDRSFVIKRARSYEELTSPETPAAPRGSAIAER